MDQVKKMDFICKTKQTKKKKNGYYLALNRFMSIYKVKEFDTLCIVHP